MSSAEDAAKILLVFLEDYQVKKAADGNLSSVASFSLTSSEASQVEKAADDNLSSIEDAYHVKKTADSYMSLTEDDMTVLLPFSLFHPKLTSRRSVWVSISTVLDDACVLMLTYFDGVKVLLRFSVFHPKLTRW